MKYAQNEFIFKKWQKMMHHLQQHEKELVSRLSGRLFAVDHYHKSLFSWMLNAIKRIKEPPECNLDDTIEFIQQIADALQKLCN